MKFHHVGLVVPNFLTARLIMQSLGDPSPPYWERVEAFSCECAFLELFPMIEVVVPDPGSRLARFLGGPSALHHLAFSMAENESPAPPLLFSEWARGARGLIVNFARPQNGLLIEYVREPSS